MDIKFELTYLYRVGFYKHFNVYLCEWLDVNHWRIWINHDYDDKHSIAIVDYQDGEIRFYESNNAFKHHNPKETIEIFSNEIKEVLRFIAKKYKNIEL